MKKRSTVFFELEAQSNFLKNIATMDQVISKSFTPSQNKLLKNHQNTTSTGAPIQGISVEELKFDAKKYGDEFNKSKYVTMYHKDQKPRNSQEFLLKKKISLKIPRNKVQKSKTDWKRLTALLTTIDENNLDYEIFDNNLKAIIRNHIEYQVF